jgi:hypothetical protein
MKTITRIAKAIQTILGQVSDEIGVETGFTQRKSKVTGSVFVQTLVFSSLEKPDWGYTQLVASAMNAGVAVSKQGLEQRFSERSAELARRVLGKAVETVIQTELTALPLLDRFNGVYIRDSSVISLPKELEKLWPGSSSSHGSSAGIKLHVRLEVCGGQLAGPVLAPGREHDSRSPFQAEKLPVGALRMGDLGFFSLKQLAEDDHQGIFWLTRYKAGTRLYDPHGQPIDLLAWLRCQTEVRFECDVLLGKQHPLTSRLVAERVPAQVVEKRKRKLREYARKKQTPLTAELLALAEWTLILTNIPTFLLSIPEALVLLRVRWQIELLFKRWKSLFSIDEWRSANPWRILTELYAKLLTVVMAHWSLLTAAWHTPHPSFWKATLVVQHFATSLALALASLTWLEFVLALIQRHIFAYCHLDTRRNRPSFFHLLDYSPCTTLA